MLREAGFLVNVTLGGGNADEQGLVIDQSPQAASMAARRTWVEIVVASGTGPRRTAQGGPPSIGPVRPIPAPPPSRSAGLSGPPAVPSGPITMPPPTPQGPTPVPPVTLPSRESPQTASVPSVAGSSAPQAIANVLQAGLIPIVEVDRSASQPAGTIVAQSPQVGSSAHPGDLVRLTVSIGADTPPLIDLPMAVGALGVRAQSMFSTSRVAVQFAEVKVPGHPYAGTGRVAAQYPVGRVPRAQAGRVTLWVVTR
jgi:hypothetical protein